MKFSHLLPLWRNLGLVARLIFGVGLIFVMFGCGLFYISLNNTIRSQAEELQEKLNADVHYLTPTLAEQAVIGDYSAIEQVLQDQVKRTEIAQIWWRGPEKGLVTVADRSVASKAPDWFIRWVNLSPQKIVTPISIGGVYYGKFVVVSDPVPAIDNIWHACIEDLEVFLLGLSACVIVIIAIVEVELQPIRELALAAEKFGRGDYSIRLPEVGAPEARLSQQAFNKMAENIEHLLSSLKLSEEKYRLIFEQAPMGIAHSTWNGDYLQVNQKFCEIVGYSASELAHLTFKELTHPDDLAVAIENTRKLRAGEITEFARDKRYICKDGSVVWVRLRRSAVHAEDNPFKYYLSIIEDITERKQAEQMLHELSLRLQEAREEERTRIAREIHDELGGALTAVKFELSIPARIDDQNDNGVAQRNPETIKLMDNAIASLRRIMADLRPSVLDDLGLWAALEWQAAEFETRMGISCAFKIQGEEKPVDTNLATAIFRIVQEALNNVAKHANATKVHISAVTAKDDMIIRIRDNGRGINKDELAKAKSFGILGMRERVRAFNGMVQITGRPGIGTTVSVKFPLN